MGLTSASWRAALAAALLALIVVVALTARSGDGSDTGALNGRDDDDSRPGAGRPGRSTSSPDPPAKPRRRGCFDRPSACGYPDTTNTGVPPGTNLTPVADADLPPGATWDPARRELSITAPGTVISGLDVRGSIVVRASNVSIKASRITSTAPAFAIAIAEESKADNTRITDVSVGGAPDSAGIPTAINNRGSNALTILRSHIHDCWECVQNQAKSGGTTTIRETYMRTSNPVTDCTDPACPHYELVFTSGNPGPMVLDHNTMLNPIDQTAVVFVNEHRHDDLTITDNLLAGGGYSIYGGVQSRRQVIVRNRFSKAFQSKGLHTNGRGRWPIPKICRPGRSAGCFGTVTAAPSQLTWSGNYWDDTLKPVRFRRAPARDRRAAGR